MTLASDNDYVNKNGNEGSIGYFRRNVLKGAGLVIEVIGIPVH